MYQKRNTLILFANFVRQNAGVSIFPCDVELTLLTHRPFTHSLLTRSETTQSQTSAAISTARVHAIFMRFLLRLKAKSLRMELVMYLELL
jgi:hypothetical protein